MDAAHWLGIEVSNQGFTDDLCAIVQVFKYF